MNGKTKTYPLRLPEELHEWLKENVKDQTINDFIVSLITEKIETFVKPQPKGVTEELPEWIEDLLNKRNTVVARYGEKLVSELEYRWEEWKCGDSGYVGEEKEFEECKAKIKPEHLNYFQDFLNLSWEKRELYKEEIKRRETEQKCGGDPNEPIYRDVTRKTIFDVFSMDEKYSVNDVAGKLGLTYMQAYMNVVPWMKNEGFHVE